MMLIFFSDWLSSQERRKCTIYLRKVSPCYFDTCQQVIEIFKLLFQLINDILYMGCYFNLLHINLTYKHWFTKSRVIFSLKCRDKLLEHYSKITFIGACSNNWYNRTKQGGVSGNEKGALVIMWLNFTNHVTISVSCVRMRT